MQVDAAVAPPEPPDSCFSTSQAHSLSFPLLRNILFPNSIFCEWMMLKAGSIPLSPLIPPPQLISWWSVLAVLKTQKWRTPSAVAQNLRDSHPVGSLPLIQSLTWIPGYYNEIRLCILAAVNLLKKKSQKHSNSFFWYAHFSYSLDRYFQITVKKSLMSCDILFTHTEM